MTKLFTMPVLVGLFLLLNLFDVITTYIGLRIGLTEGNLFPAWILRQFGEWAMYSSKAILMIMVLVGVLGLRFALKRQFFLITNTWLLFLVMLNVAQLVGVF
jgi:hypothetical protein